MAEGDHPDEHWSYPHFHSIVQCIRDHINESAALTDEDKRSSKGPKNDAPNYILEDGFLPQDRSWLSGIQVQRMRKKSKVLYRPQIVNALVERIEELLASEERVGLLVKGPQGVGKSHSLINLTRFLMASNEYWVTIIPDCDYWRSERDFFEFLLKSVGVDPLDSDLDYDATIDPDFKKLIHDIDKVLTQSGMKWVFIFDQINKIFSRPQFHLATDVGRLPFPFELMKTILKEGRIISIISASANNDASRRDNHDGFDVFEHKPQFDNDEINLLYPQDEISRWDWEEVEYATGFVPLYLNLWANNPNDYSGKVRGEIREALTSLEEETRKLGEKRWAAIVQSAINCLLCLSSYEEPKFLDRKYTRVTKDPTTAMYSIVALFPLVAEQYRNFFWDELDKYIDAEEIYILDVCTTATQTARGCLFEQLTIRRLLKSKLADSDFHKILTDAGLVNEIASTSKTAKKFTTVVQVPGCTRYPQLRSGEGNCTYFVPLAPNFPAADLIIHVGKIVIAFQITISPTHDNVLTSLQEKASAAGWDEEQAERIILVYLCPTKDTANQLEQTIGEQAGSPNRIRTRSWKCRRVTATDRYISLFYSIHDLAHLKDLQWRS